jgi:hypothetical protein
LLSLTEVDFAEEETTASGESIEAVLGKLDAVIGLAGSGAVRGGLRLVKVKEGGETCHGSASRTHPKDYLAGFTVDGSEKERGGEGLQ